MLSGEDSHIDIVDDFKVTSWCLNMLKWPIQEDCLGLSAYWARFSKMQRKVCIFKTDSGDESHYKEGDDALSTSYEQ